MPEGHVIHRFAAALAELLSGEAIQASSPQGRFSEGAALIDGSMFAGVFAHGKHLFVSFEAATHAPHILHVHLGLYGGWTFAVAAGRTFALRRNLPLTVAGEGKAPGLIDDGPVFTVPAPRGAVRLRLVGKQALADLNGPSRCEVLTAAEVEAIRSGLGPDPLLKDSDPAMFIRAVRSSRRVIGELIMDQRVISGIGNIYRAELLFRHRIHPATPGRQMSDRKLKQLWSDAVVLLADGKDTGVIVTTDAGRIHEPLTGWTKPAERASDEEADLRWYTYRRSGRPCHWCGALIETAVLANRAVYWCPHCQRAPAK